MIKKINLIGLLVLGLVSCKNDTKTKNTDSKTVKITDNKTPKERAEVPEIKPAITDSAGVYTQKFLLEKGKTYPLTSFQKDVTTIKDPTGKTVSGTQEMTDEITFTVDDVVDGIYHISVNLVGKVNKSSSQGKTVVIDTKKTAPKEEQLKVMWTINKALSGNKLSLKMDSLGQVQAITGFDVVYNKVTQQMGGLIKNAEQKKQFLESFKQGFNEKTFKEQFTQSLSFLPKKGVKIGETWSESENLTPDGKLKLTTTYKLENVSEGKAIISVKGSIPKKSESKKQEGITHSISIEGSQKGKITLNANTGWIENSNQTMTTVQKETLSDGKQSQSMTQTTNASIIINP